ncbi:MAG: aldehyde dehydrogenase family protein, partial [Actinomycetota bacterium]
MSTYSSFYINGQWVKPSTTDSLSVYDSVTEQVMATIPAGGAADVDAAAKAARAAFDSWSGLPREERAKFMSRIGDALAGRMDEIATVISKETGMTKMLSQLVQVGLPINSFKQAASVAETFEYSEMVGSSMVVREPIGVVGCITPWNYPLHQIAAKVAFAMAAGCTVVLKPSEVAPIDAFMLAEIIHEVGLPAGVFNMLTGTGPVVGEAIAAHPLVDMVSFTGSTRAGKRVAQVGAETVKKVSLELGGKSANIIGDDLDEATFAKAVMSGVGKAFLNSGQTCSALTRMLVPKAKLAEAEQHAATAASKMTVGDPFADGTNLGPLASAAQRDRVQSYIQKGIDEGAKVLVGGLGAPEGLSNGYYVKPTVFTNVDN